MLFKNVISKMITNHKYSLTNYICDCLTVCRQIADVGLNC